MNSGLLLISLLLFILGLILSFVCIIRWVMKKPVKRLGKITKALLICGVLLFTGCLFAEMGLSEAMLLAGLIVLLTSVMLLVRGLFRLLRRKNSRRILLMALILFVLSIGLLIGSNSVSKAMRTKRMVEGEIAAIEVQTDLDFVVEDGEEPIEVPLTNGFEERTIKLKGSYQIAYDADKYPLLPLDSKISLEMCLAEIRDSRTIPEEMKEYFLDFVQRIGNQYPKADLTPLYHNLSTLKVKKANTVDMLFKTRSASAYACYVKRENTVYLPPDISFVEGEWDYQVLLHEFCHAARGTYYPEGDETIEITYCTDTSLILLEEAMNSAFSCSLLNYYEPDIAYQMPSNYLRIMLECMEFDLTDYMNHCDCYFLRQLDEYAGYTNYAQVIWKLITLQREDWQDDQIDLPAEKYEPIYDFLCELYFDRFLTEDMGEADAIALAEELAEKAGYDCPEDYKFEADYFTAYMTKLLAERAECAG